MGYKLKHQGIIVILPYMKALNYMVLVHLTITTIVTYLRHVVINQLKTIFIYGVLFFFATFLEFLFTERLDEQPTY